jgi:CheY-like chemotaxis protein
MKTIFFVEDDAVIMHVYGTKFLREGFLIEVAEDGLTAMKQLKTSKPDLIVLDLMMPKFSGVDVLKFIRAEPTLKSTPVIILSNAYMSDLAQEAAKLGAELALLKSSCTPAILVDAVKDLLNGVAITPDASKRIAVKHSPEKTSLW